MKKKSTIGSMPRLIVLALTLMIIVSGCQTAALPKKIDDKYGNYYEIFVASFYDSDGDGLGDLKGIEEKLDYLNDGSEKEMDDLMIEGLWLMPIMPSPSYHKYDVTDYYAIDSSYGSMDDFESLMKATDEVDVDVLIDLVLNHSSNEHPWFKAAVKNFSGESNVYKDYYNFSNQAKANYHSVPGYDDLYYEGSFGPHMPDLNLDNELVREEILKIARFWLDKGVDGFRLDAVPHFYDGNNDKNIEFLKWFNESLKADYEDVYIVGEAWSDGSTILNLYKSGIDSFFNFPFSGGTGEIVMNTKMKKGNDMSEAIELWQEDVWEVNTEAIDAPFLSNHDNARSGGSLNRNLDLQKLGANVYQLMPGNTFIYYGEEIGMLGSGRDENKRQPMVWSVNNHVGMTQPPENTDKFYDMEAGVEEQLEDEASLLVHYRELMKVKRQFPEIARGSVKRIEMDEPGLSAYESSWVSDEGTRSVTVIHNLNSEAKTIQIEAYAGRDFEVVAMLPLSVVHELEFNPSYEIPAMTSIILKEK